jgi:hypothetical protein
MITDAQTWLSKAQALTSGTAYSDSYDAGLARDIGIGHSIRAKVLVDTTFTGGTNETFNLVESANADLSSPTVLVSSGAILEAALTAGASVMDVVIPKTSKRYVGFQYVASGTHTAGKVNALLVLDTASGDAFPVENGL